MTRRRSTLLTLAVSGFVAVLARDPSCYALGIVLCLAMVARGR